MRVVLVALGQAAMVSGSSVIEFGTRNLALHAALTFSQAMQPAGRRSGVSGRRSP